VSERIFAQIYSEIERINRRLDETRESLAFQHTGSGVPSHEAAEGVFYWDYTNDDLYVNTDGSTTWQEIGGGGPAGTHAMLSATHSDSTPAAGTRGAIMAFLGPSPTWTRLDHPSGVNYYLRSNAADPDWTEDLTMEADAWIGTDSNTHVRFVSSTSIYVNLGNNRFLEFYENDPTLNYISVGADGTAVELRMNGNEIRLDADDDTYIWGPSDDTVQVVCAGATTFQFDDSFYVNDTANGDSQIGITVNQGTNDDHIMTWKSTPDVNHTLTLQCEIDTFGFIDKYDPTSGGLRITGVKDDDATNAHALRLRAFLDEAPQTTKAANAYGVMTFGVWEGDGANDVQEITTAGANLFSWDTAGVTGMVLSVGGELWTSGLADFSDGGVRTTWSEVNISNPPTDAELDTAFGTPAAAGEGFIALVDDNNAGLAVRIIASIGGFWWYSVQLAKAV
jgi:hypothetical protein